METERKPDRAALLQRDYLRQPCGQKHRVMIDSLSKTEAVFSKMVTLDDCVIDSDDQRTAVIQGGVIPILVDFAGVYLARMNSDAPGIRPLARLEEKYSKPFVFGKDERMVARAMLVPEQSYYRIVIDVIIENEKGDRKGEARLEFARRSFKK
ncbi:hypothetical protein KGO95_04360 [Patescibacteria group bacterium]|nr:hypothetical protein [Patescibacteria group bacterium]